MGDIAPIRVDVRFAVGNPFPVLVVAAFGPELQRFRELRPEISTREVGVGALAAAAGMATGLSPPPEGVILVGTCGAYPGSGLAIGARVVVARSRVVDPSVLSGTSVALGEHVLESDATLVARVAAIGTAVTCATTLSLTTSRELGETIARATGAAVEHLETHGVAVACAAAKVPFVAVLVVANHVGPNGRAEWSEHHRRVEDELGEALATHVESIRR